MKTHTMNRFAAHLVWFVAFLAGGCASGDSPSAGLSSPPGQSGLGDHVKIEDWGITANLNVDGIATEAMFTLKLVRVPQTERKSQLIEAEFDVPAPEGKSTQLVSRELKADGTELVMQAAPFKGLVRSGTYHFKVRVFDPDAKLTPVGTAFLQLTVEDSFDVSRLSLGSQHTLRITRKQGRQKN